MDLAQISQQMFLAQLISWAPKVALGTTTFAVFWLLANWCDQLIETLGKKAPKDQRTVFALASDCARYALIITGAVSALGTLGIQIGALVAGLGLTGFALGFALKDALGNLLAGVMVLVYRPFRVHDRIKVKTFEGEVAEIDLRYTTLKDGDAKILIPNSVLLSDPITVLNDSA